MTGGRHLPIPVRSRVPRQQMRLCVAEIEDKGVQKTEIYTTASYKTVVHVQPMSLDAAVHEFDRIHIVCVSDECTVFVV